MSGRLVTLVNDHGPRDHNAWAVLVGLAEKMRSPVQSYDATTEALAHAARLSPSSAKRGIAVLVDEGWVKRIPGHWKGRASTYWLDLTAFPEDAVNELLRHYAKGVTQTPSSNPQGVTQTPLEGQRGSHRPIKGVTVTQHSVSVTTPSSPEPLATAPEPSTWEAEDEEMRTALTGLPTVPWKPALRAALGVALVERGHAATSVNRYLLAHFRANAVGDPYAVVLTNLRAIPPVVAEAPAPTGPRCAVCSERESDCRRREATSGHSFTPPQSEKRNDENPEPPAVNGMVAAMRHKATRSAG